MKHPILLITACTKSGVCVEGIAPDDLVEAVRIDGARAFAFGVQGHPEWHSDQSPWSHALFVAFGAAVYQRRSI